MCWLTEREGEREKKQSLFLICKPCQNIMRTIIFCCHIDQGWRTGFLFSPSASVLTDICLAHTRTSRYVYIANRWSNTIIMLEGREKEEKKLWNPLCRRQIQVQTVHMLEERNSIEHQGRRLSYTHQSILVSLLTRGNCSQRSAKASVFIAIECFVLHQFSARSQLQTRERERTRDNCSR